MSEEIDKLFDEMMEGLEEGLDIISGKKKPSRAVTFEPIEVKEIRSKTGKTQKAFATWLDIPLNTLRNWEQGKRQPTGPAKVLLKLVGKNPGQIEELLNA